LRVMRDGRSFTVGVAADGVGLVSHARAALLAVVADRVGLTTRALAGLRERRRRHEPGRVIRDLAVMLADGGDCLSDLRAVRDQQPLFGPVASDTTAFRLIDRIASDPAALEALRVARAIARTRAWELGARPEPHRSARHSSDALDTAGGHLERRAPLPRQLPLHPGVRLNRRRYGELAHPWDHGASLS
jgi:hypothetical protein